MNVFVTVFTKKKISNLKKKKKTKDYSVRKQEFKRWFFLLLKEAATPYFIVIVIYVHVERLFAYRKNCLITILPKTFIYSNKKLFEIKLSKVILIWNVH